MAFWSIVDHIITTMMWTTPRVLDTGLKAPGCAVRILFFLLRDSVTTLPYGATTHHPDVHTLGLVLMLLQ